VDRKVVHFRDRELGVLSSDELDEPAAFAGRDLAVRDIAKVVEEGLSERETGISNGPKEASRGVSDGGRN
jgi:hypothetical protein